MAAENAADKWQLVPEDREAVIEALQGGECDGILPAAVGIFDQFAEFCADIGPLELPAELPDLRQRRSVAARFLGSILIHKALFRLPSLKQTARVLFHSPDLLRRLGFNWRQVHEGFYAGGQRKPFNEEGLGDFVTHIAAEVLWEYQLQLVGQLLERCPELTGDGTLVLHCLEESKIPHGDGGAWALGGRERAVQSLGAQQLPPGADLPAALPVCQRTAGGPDAGQASDAGGHESSSR